MDGYIRDYTDADFERVKEIHEASEINYQLPDLGFPFIVSKVFVSGGVVRAFGGLRLQAEAYLVIDKGKWAGAAEKFEVIRQLDETECWEAWLKGIDTAVLWLPPGFDRFGTKDRLGKLGYAKDRDGWISYSKKTQ